MSVQNYLATSGQPAKLGFAARFADVALAGFVVTIIGAMILPLPMVLIDLLVAKGVLTRGQADDLIAEARASGPLTVVRAADGNITLSGEINVDEAHIEANVPGSNEGYETYMEIAKANGKAVGHGRASVVRRPRRTRTWSSARPGRIRRITARMRANSSVMENGFTT